MSEVEARRQRVAFLIRLARFRKACRLMNKLEPMRYPQWVREASKLQGITIKD